jgi:IclR family KDG regulon transcriptional repressor
VSGLLKVAPRSEQAQPSNLRVPALAKAFRLLDAIAQAGAPLGVSELARRLGLGKSTVHGLVTTLEALGVLQSPNGSKKYGLGPLLPALCARATHRPDLRQIARPSLESLAEATEQTSFLGIPSDDHVTILDIVHGRPGLSISAPVGTSIPLLAGAVGKVIVASWDAQRRRRFLADTVLPAFTKAAITEPNAYERAVEQTQTRGVALDVDEYIEGVRAAAAAVWGPQRSLAAIVWVAGFSRHIDLARLEVIADEVKRSAGDITRKLAGLAGDGL